MKKKVCAAMVFVFTAVMASGCVKKEEIQKYSHVDYAMGTVTNTTLYGRMMTLGLDSGEEITLSANGEDEEAGD